MGDTYTIAGLPEKRARIAGIIADHEKKMAGWRNALRHLDATIRLFDAELDPDRIPRIRPYRQSENFYGPPLARFVLDQLRQASGPIAAFDIYRAAIDAHGLDSDAQTKTATVERILRYLRQKAADGLVQKHGTTHDVRWSLTENSGTMIPPKRSYHPQGV